MDNKKIGAKIRECREACNLSQKGLADKVGISLRYLGDIERGAKIPKLATFIDLLNAMNASADYVLIDELNSAYRLQASELEKSLEELEVSDRNFAMDLLKTIIENLKNR